MRRLLAHAQILFSTNLPRRVSANHLRLPAAHVSPAIALVVELERQVSASERTPSALMMADATMPNP